MTCYCSACRALCPDITDLARFRRRAMIEFLGELCSHVKQVNPQMKTTIALHPRDISLGEDLAGIGTLDVLGGHLFWDILQEHVMMVEQWGRELLETTRKANKRSQLWLQNFNIDAQNAADMETAFGSILGLEPDELGCYYFWRNNADPLQVWETTRRLLKRVPRRQLHWQLHQPARSESSAVNASEHTNASQTASALLEPESTPDTSSAPEEPGEPLL